jgi:3-oxoacyl-[acyl-carrier-protein] synthase II
MRWTVRRVVVTGMGAVTPAGATANETWDAFVNGRSGIGPISLFDASEFDVRIAGEVKDFSTDGVISAKEARHMDRSVQMALVATREALFDSGLEIDEAEAPNVGVIYGSGAGGFGQLLAQQQIIDERGPGRVSPFFIPNFLPDTASGMIAIQCGAQGPNMAVVSACATGGTAVGEAMETIRRGDCDVIITGGAEAPLKPVIMAGFINMKVLSSYSDDPAKAARPFDLNRDGFVLSEGAGALVLEELEYAKRRGARIYAEVVGYGSTNDAYHMAAPRPDSAGPIRAMQMALRKAEIPLDSVDYINAHGTGTVLNDKLETGAVKTVFGEHAYHLAMTSTKSMVGHMMGAAGAIESIACIRAIYDGVIPPTINLDAPDPDCDLDYVPRNARETSVRVAMTNSIGLGGHNSCVIFRSLS